MKILLLWLYICREWHIICVWELCWFCAYLEKCFFCWLFHCRFLAFYKFLLDVTSSIYHNTRETWEEAMARCKFQNGFFVSSVSGIEQTMTKLGLNSSIAVWTADFIKGNDTLPGNIIKLLIIRIFSSRLCLNMVSCFIL